MPSRGSALAALVALAALAAPRPGTCATPVVPSAPVAHTAGGPQAAIGDREVQAAVKALQSDPLMGGLERHRRLHWREPDPAKDTQPAAWLVRVLHWFAQAGAWLASSARALVIVAVALCVALLGALIWRAWLRNPQSTKGAEGLPPTHVRGLDIRPDELPADVPGAARALWQAGDQRAALVLLYRSLLSRLAHGFQVPIRDSSTEGDCLSLARGRLPEAAQAYAAEFLRAWLSAVYAGQWPEAARFEALCAGHMQLQGAAP